MSFLLPNTFLFVYISGSHLMHFGDVNAQV